MSRLFNKAFLAMLAFATASGVQAGEGRLLRFPATNGSEVAFSYAGDLYRVPIAGGVAQRLTSHVGYEVFARYSPDGKQIAFTGQYDGNTEVYVIPSDGGEPRRVTYTATNARDDMGDRMGPNNIVMNWTPDGKNIVYRNRVDEGFVGQLWTAPSAGGMATQLPLPEGGFCSYSPDGTKLAYNRVFREFRTWKYYKGGMADDIWVYDLKTKQTENVTGNVSQDISPMWIGDEIYFMSDRDKTMNIFVYNTTTKQTQRVTDFTEYDVKFASAGGGKIVYENAGYIYVLDPATKQSRRIDVELNVEGIYARNARVQTKDFVTNAELSPDGNRIAVTARGEVFDVPSKKGVTRNITHTPGANDREAQWSPDGKQIAYISDITGESELWMRSADGGDPVQLTTGNDAYISGFKWSPDSKQIVYVDRGHRVVMVNVAGRSKQTLLTDSAVLFPVPNFSPDGRWLTYYKSGKNQMNVVYLYDTSAKKEYAVTDGWYDSNAPQFSSDGKYLIFASGRDYNPIYSEIEWNFAMRNMEGVYMVMLSKDTPSPFLPKDDKVSVKAGDDSKETPSKTKKGKDDDKSKSGDASKPATKVDVEGIADRVVKLPLTGSHYGNFYCDGKKLWYYGNGGTHVYDFAEQKDQLVAAGAVLTASNDLSKAVLSKGGKLYVVPMPQGKVELSEAVNLDDMVADVDYAAEWKQIYNEAWRVYRDGFYVSNMHGVDWNKIHDKYAVLLPYVKHRLDLTYVIGGMISELACGHAYVDGGDHPEADRSNMGLLGATLKRDGDAYKIEKILTGAPDRESLRSPLLEPGMNVKEGEYIVAVDGVSTKGVENIYSLLQGKADVLTELTVAGSASGNGGRKVVVKPIADEYPLMHYEWIQRNIKTVSEKTNGRVGYIYIPDMGPEGLSEFARYYFSQIDKEAVIVDDRNNGGGNISPMVIERLLRQPYRMTMYRTSNRTGMIPDATIYGPKVLLVNKYSASDGDLFPWSFKANKIGTVVGTRTWGGIVGITRSMPYMDGTQITVPFFTNYDAKTGEWIIENHGVDPDVLIDNDPAKEFAGEDQQLNKAIEIILEQLKDRKPLPGVPAPRTLKDLGVQE